VYLRIDDFHFRLPEYVVSHRVVFDHVTRSISSRKTLLVENFATGAPQRRPDF
jgi:hypothetical protein